MTRRCFIAIDIESVERRSQLADIRDSVTQYGEMRPVPPENFHITMNFLGDVKEDEIDMIKHDIRESLDHASHGERTITVGGLGIFPKKSYITVVWAGVLHENQYLSRVHESVTEPLPEKHIDEHDFTPHITLARVSKITDEEKTSLHEILDRHENTALFEKKIDSVKLKESVLQSDSPTYRTIEEYEL